MIGGNGGNSENDTDFEESGDENENELPSKKSKFFNLFSNYLETHLETKISKDENPIHQDFCKRKL